MAKLALAYLLGKFMGDKYAGQKQNASTQAEGNNDAMSVIEAATGNQDPHIELQPGGDWGIEWTGERDGKLTLRVNALNGGVTVTVNEMSGGQSFSFECIEQDPMQTRRIHLAEGGRYELILTADHMTSPNETTVVYLEDELEAVTQENSGKPST